MRPRRSVIDSTDGDDGGSGIRGGSIVESVCCPRGDGWTVEVMC